MEHDHSQCNFHLEFENEKYRCPETVYFHPDLFEGKRYCFLHALRFSDPKAGPHIDWRQGAEFFNSIIEQSRSWIANAAQEHSVCGFRGAVFPDGFTLDQRVGDKQWPSLLFHHCRSFGSWQLASYAISGSLQFSHCQFNGPLSISGVELESEFKIEDCEFLGKGHTSKIAGFRLAFPFVIQRVKSSQDMQLEHVTSTSDFAISDFDIQASIRIDNCHFDSLQFSEQTGIDQLAILDTTVMKVSRFEDCRFNKLVQIHKTRLLTSSNFNRVYFGRNPDVKETVFTGNVVFENVEFKQGGEDFYRLLKSDLEQRRFFWEATQFHGYAMDERRKSLPKHRRLFLFLYKLFNDYGRSYWRAFMSMLCAVGIFGVGYSFSASLVPGSDWSTSFDCWPDLAKGIFFSAETLVLPFSVGKNLPIVTISPIVWACSVFESALLIVLFAMGVLTFRRHFKI